MQNTPETAGLHRTDLALGLLALGITVAIVVGATQAWVFAEKIRPNRQGVLRPPATRSFTDYAGGHIAFLVLFAAVLAVAAVSVWVDSRWRRTETHERAKLCVVACLADLLALLWLLGAFDPALGRGNWSFDGLSAVSVEGRTRTVFLAPALLTVWLSLLGLLVSGVAYALGARARASSSLQATGAVMAAAVAGFVMPVVVLYTIWIVAIALGGGGGN